MKRRTPASIFIPLTMIGILIALMMVIPPDFQPKRSFLGMFSNLGNQLINIFSYPLVWIILILSLVMLLIVNAINKVIESQKFEKLSEEDKQAYLAKSEKGYIAQLFSSSYEKQQDAIEDEILIDHGFDGIKELDNSLPQWWLSLFYFGCAFMVVYVLAFFFANFANPIAEYETESAALEEKWEVWLANNDIDQSEAVNHYFTDQKDAKLAKGADIFANQCAICHTANGGGQVGPNLTDDYWVNILEDSLFYNVYNVVYNGSPNNAAMKAFAKEGILTGLDVEAVASYIYYLNQELPDVTVADGGLEAQGTLAPWVEGAPKTETPKSTEDTENEESVDKNPTKEEVDPEAEVAVRFNENDLKPSA